MDRPPGPGYYQATDGKWYPVQPPPQFQQTQFAPPQQYAQPPPTVIVQKKNGSGIVGCLAFLLIGGIVAIILIAWIGASSKTATTTGQPVTTLSGAALDAVLAKAQPVDVDAIVKNPEAFRGGVFVLSVRVTQFDAATGKCVFRANWDVDAHQFGMDYKGDNAVFTSGDGKQDCAVLNGIDENDQVKVWVKGTGAVNYDTQIGGHTTVPGFEVLKAEVTKKQ